MTSCVRDILPFGLIYQRGFETFSCRSHGLGLIRMWAGLDDSGAVVLGGCDTGSGLGVA